MRHSVVTRVEAPHVRALKLKGGPSKKKAHKRNQEVSQSDSDFRFVIRWANTSSPQRCSITTIPPQDGRAILEHGGARTIAVGALGWPANKSKAVGGLVGEGFGEVIVGRLISPSAGGKVGEKAHGEELVALAPEATLLWGSSSITEGVGCKILST